MQTERLTSLEQYRHAVKDSTDRFNGSEEPFFVLADALEVHGGDDLIKSYDLSAGKAMDSLRIELRQYTGTVPQPIAQAIYESGLEIFTVGGYMTVTIGHPERRGGDLDDEEEVSRP